jgi:hypothetical protein
MADTNWQIVKVGHSDTRIMLDLRDPSASYFNGVPRRFVTWWWRTHFENSMIDSLCDRGHTPYREISHRAVSYVMDRASIA